MSVTAQTLRTLHRIHQQLADLRERFDRGPKQIKARTATVERLEQDLAKVQGESKGAHVAADQKQLELKTSEGKIKELKVKLNAASSNREYQALKDQIAADEMANSVLADEILEALEKLDEFKGRIHAAQENLTKGRADLDKIKGTVSDNESTLQGDILRLETELKTTEQSLPEEFREAYERMAKSRGWDAMARVDGESCGGCYQNITPNMYNSLRMGKVIVCQTCGRLLYLPEEP